MAETKIFEETRKSKISQKNFQSSTQLAAAKKIELTNRAIKEREVDKGIVLSEHSLMLSSLQKEYVREVVGV